jgi:hypothetical protein
MADMDEYLDYARKAAGKFAKEFGKEHFSEFHSAATYAIITGWERIKSHTKPKALAALLIRRELYRELENIPTVRVPRTSYKRGKRGPHVVECDKMAIPAPRDDSQDLYEWCANAIERDAVRQFMSGQEVGDVEALHAVAKRVTDSRNQDARADNN